jgi:transposase InsO family protein
MRQAEISGLIRRWRRGTTIPVPGVRAADELVKRGFARRAPNVLWCADITYLETWQRRCYLAAVQDLYSRLIVGWQLAEHKRSGLVVEALGMAIPSVPPQGRADALQRPGIAARLPVELILCLVRRPRPGDDLAGDPLVVRVRLAACFRMQLGAVDRTTTA